MSERSFVDGASAETLALFVTGAKSMAKKSLELCVTKIFEAAATAANETIPSKGSETFTF